MPQGQAKNNKLIIIVFLFLLPAAPMRNTATNIGIIIG